MKPVIYVFITFIIIVVIFVVLTSTDGTSGWFSSCTKCKAGYYRGKNDDPTTCIGCNGGYSTNDLSGQTTCQKCPENTYATVNSSSCSACANNTTSKPGSVKCSATCFPGQRLATSVEKTTTGDECVDCGENTYSDSYNATDCTSCPNGTEIRSEIVGENGERTSSKLCTPCKPGTGANPDNTSPGCSPCGDNEYSDGWGELCKQCPDGQTHSEDHTHCWPPT